jgi:hypothetical protein
MVYRTENDDVFDMDKPEWEDDNDLDFDYPEGDDPED